MLKIISTTINRGAVFIFLLIIAASCQKNTSEPALDVTVAAAIKDAAYGNDTAQKMDIYLPANRSASATKVLVMIHGGSWNEGDKDDFSYIADTLGVLLPGYAIFNINYRLSANGVNIFPVPYNDVKLAIQFIKDHAAKYAVNSQKIVVGGASAGGELALLAAYSSNDGTIKAAVDLFGPADLTWLYNNHPFPLFAQAVLVNYLGVTPAQNAQVYKDASPINMVTAATPPTIVFQGTADDVVPQAESDMLVDKLNQFNVVNQYIIYPGEGHGWDGKNLTDTYLKIAAFLNKNVN